MFADLVDRKIEVYTDGILVKRLKTKAHTPIESSFGGILFTNLEKIYPLICA